MAELKKQLDKKTLVKAWALTYSSEACYNYERLQALGNANQMITVVRKLYDTEEEQVEALKKYMVFFNTRAVMDGYCYPRYYNLHGRADR